MATHIDSVQLYNRVGKLIGWDFSHLKVYAEVAKNRQRRRLKLSFFARIGI